MVKVLTEDAQARLQNAVARAEKKTSAEIVVMVMRSVTDYRAVELMAAAGAAIALPAALLPFTAIPALWIWLAQLALFILLAVGLPLYGAGRLVVGQKRIARDVEAAARAEFFAHGLRRTSKRAAILLFVAVREQKVQVLYDDGAAGIVEEDAWGELAASIAISMKSGDAVSALEHAVDDVAEMLKGELPPSPDNQDELPNVITG